MAGLRHGMMIGYDFERKYIVLRNVATHTLTLRDASVDGGTVITHYFDNSTEKDECTSYVTVNESIVIPARTTKFIPVVARKHFPSARLHVVFAPKNTESQRVKPMGTAVVEFEHRTGMIRYENNSEESIVLRLIHWVLLLKYVQCMV